MTPRPTTFEEIFSDDYCKKILHVTKDFRSVSEISSLANIPLITVYRKIKLLIKYDTMEIRGYLINGVRFNKYRRTLTFRFNKHNPRYNTILSLIQEKQGISYSELKSQSGFPNGTLSHCIRNLVNDEKIKVKRTSRRSWFFSSPMNADEMNIIVQLRKETTKSILVFLLGKETSSFKEIKNFVKKSPGTTSLAITHLIDLGIIKRIPGIRPSYVLTDKNRVYEIIKRVEPSMIDTLTDRFSDTFSYL